MQDHAPGKRKSIVCPCHSKSPWVTRGPRSQCLQEVHDRVDLFVVQNPVSSERRHHGQRIALGGVDQDGDQFVAVGILALDVGQRRPDRAGKIAALDVVAGQAIALAAIERQLSALPRPRTAPRRDSEGASMPSNSASAAAGIRADFLEWMIFKGAFPVCVISVASCRAVRSCAASGPCLPPWR